ncbi:TFIIS helical bundle-like domain containing protein [Methylobacterium sp. P1-11]|nr:TFIIS helical bundle-like domain containing protein [Methylobacterium sp. P1-11]KAA0123636.1 TFIIS helical bundle-like domain containing protein [Methylobacterium sp. P1-11]
MNLIGRIVTKILGTENRPVDRDDRNASTATPLGRLVTKILGK